MYSYHGYHYLSLVIISYHIYCDPVHTSCIYIMYIHHVHTSCTYIKYLKTCSLEPNYRVVLNSKYYTR